MTLAIHGGEPVRDRPFPEYRSYGIEERNAAHSVVASGMLSGFIADDSDAFWGGYHVKQLENEWCDRFDVDHAISFNSATSALTAACFAVGIQNGMEVIVPPWTMPASVTCVIMNQGMPVFVDVEPDTFCIDPDAIARRIARRTRAIVAVDLFGCSARYDEILDLARDKGLAIIEDAAQAPGAIYHDIPAGTIGDIGVYSLNQHKTIHCGEGGIAVTNDEDLATKMALWRNHGEVADREEIGGNFRLSEIHAAVARVQLARLDELTAPRIRYAETMTEGLRELEGIIPPIVPDNVRHVFYRYVIKVANAKRFAEALKAEGIIPITAGYTPPLYHKRALRYFAFDGPLPIVERLHKETVLLDLHAGMSELDIADTLAAFRKVWQHRNEL
jgi:dTDP-4-amino-4,6-dideoxygalactose transaminase